DLHSALPLLLYIQLLGITENKTLIPIADMIQNMKILSTRNDFEFKWEEFSHRGYIRRRGESS
ncbi:MAG: hypothetical protein ACREBU_16405, partial [Nitrososphaera sp.]